MTAACFPSSFIIFISILLNIAHLLLFFFLAQSHIAISPARLSRALCSECKKKHMGKQNNMLCLIAGTHIEPSQKEKQIQINTTLSWRSYT